MLDTIINYIQNIIHSIENWFRSWVWCKKGHHFTRNKWGIGWKQSYCLKDYNPEVQPEMKQITTHVLEFGKKICDGMPLGENEEKSHAYPLDLDCDKCSNLVNFVWLWILSDSFRFNKSTGN
ncbi:hypothetical protein LCGC14_0174570 [marine sediment metagenome]|uniref:Uncharacterized protein n=1 Tax=marine sediment metagenome TaxID=412755 RepID=A0A0F9XTG5_9ZZZZ